MTKRQARSAFLAGAGVMPPSVAPVALNANNNLDRMKHCARFEEWWQYGTQFSRAKEPRK